MLINIKNLKAKFLVFLKGGDFMSCEYFLANDKSSSECECKNCIYLDGDFCPADREEKFGLITSERG